jgi:hypothetical protein
VLVRSPQICADFALNYTDFALDCTDFVVICTVCTN